jgi:hypothetical protein
MAQTTDKHVLTFASDRFFGFVEGTEGECISGEGVENTRAT